MVEPELDVHEIQGNSLRGFNVPALTLLGLKIDDPSTAKAWLSALSHRIDTVAANFRGEPCTEYVYAISKE